MINKAKEVAKNNEEPNSRELEVLVDIMNNENIVDYINYHTKKELSDRDYMDLIQEYKGTPYLFVFVPKNAYVANILYPMDQYKEIDIEYNDVYLNKIFPDRIKFNLNIEKQPSVVALFSEIDRKINNFDVVVENVDVNKMKNFNLTECVDTDVLEYKNIIDKIKELKETSEEFKEFVSDVGGKSLEETIVQFLPKVIKLVGQYDFKEDYIKSSIDDSFTEYSKTYFKLLSKEYYEKNFENRKKMLKSFYTLGKISLSIFYPPALLSVADDVKAFIEFVDLVSESKDSVSDYLSIEGLDIDNNYIEFRNSNCDSLKEYYISKFQEVISKGFKDFAKMNVNLPLSVYEVLFNEFANHHLLPVIDQLDEFNMKRYNEATDKERFLFEYIYDEKSKEISLF